jgi:hypothetical protein
VLAVVGSHAVFTVVAHHFVHVIPLVVFAAMIRLRMRFIK